MRNSQIHAISGKVAQDRGYKRAFLIAPNYQAGRDAFAGFKSAFKGEIVEEDFVPLTQVDFQADLAKIAAAKPDVIYAFMPGGLGVNLVKQFRQSGLADGTPFLSAFTVDESTLPAQQDAAVGLYGGMDWAPNTDTPANAAFVKAFMAAYHYVPASYAMPWLRRGAVDRQCDEEDRWRHGGQGQIARSDGGGGFHLAPRRLQVQHQPFSRSRICT